MNSVASNSLMPYRSLQDELSIATTLDRCMKFLPEVDTTLIKVNIHTRAVGWVGRDDQLAQNECHQCHNISSWPFGLELRKSFRHI